MPVQGIRRLEDKRWTSGQESRRFSQCNMKESENKGDGGDNGQGQKSLLSNRTWQRVYTGRWGVGKRRSLTERFNSDRELLFKE